MTQNELKDGLLVDGRVVLRKEVGEFMKGKAFNTPKEKIAFFAAVHAAERAEVNPLQLTDTDYRDILYAVNIGKYVVDTGNYYINIGNPVKREEFLSLSGIQTSDEGVQVFDWDFEGFSNAKLFTQEEIETIVPEPYRNSMYLIMENIAKERYGKTL
jgi:hypothetical protein